MLKKVTNLEIVGVADAGTAGKERLVLRVRRPCNLGNYAVIDTTYEDDESIANLNRHFYWFPDQDVDEGEYILLYTNQGKEGRTRDRAGDILNVFYWGLASPETIWNKDADAATVVRLSALAAKRIPQQRTMPRLDLEKRVAVAGL